MITAEISRFTDEDVHRIAYVVCSGQCGWIQWFGFFDSSLAINYHTFGSDRRKLVDNAYAATRQWRHSSMTSIFIDAQLRRSAEYINAQFWRFWGNLTPYILSAIVQTPKRHFLAWLRVISDTLRESPSTDRFSRRVRGTKNKSE